MTPHRNGHRVTIEDVAREAGISYSTVSRVVSGKGYVGEEARDKVIAAVGHTGYVVNRQARGLAGGGTQVIGLVVPDLDTSYIGEIIRGIDNAIVAVGYDLMLYTTHHRQQREQAFASLVTTGLADGLLVILPSNPTSYLESLKVLRFPYVLIDHGGINDPGPSVGATNFQGGYDAARYLVELGHHRIGFITGDLSRGCSHDRLAGFQNALNDGGVAFDPSLVREGDFLQPLGFKHGRDLLASDPPPTAIVASNDVSAFGVMEAVRACGMRIGDDISIVGFDDIPGASYVYPPLTTVHQPLAEMGRQATRMLLEMIDRPGYAGERIDLPTHLVVRESCRPRAGPEGG